MKCGTGSRASLVSAWRAVICSMHSKMASRCASAYLLLSTAIPFTYADSTLPDSSTSSSLHQVLSSSHRPCHLYKWRTSPTFCAPANLRLSTCNLTMSSSRSICTSRRTRRKSCNAWAHSAEWRVRCSLRDFQPRLDRNRELES
jgi:hypothetical protein